MKRIRMVVALGVITGMLVFGAVVAYAGWYWNARINVEGTQLQTAWGVLGDKNGDYATSITVSLPTEAEASVVEVSPNETVELVSNSDLACSSNGIEALVVSPTGSDIPWW